MSKSLSPALATLTLASLPAESFAIVRDGSGKVGRGGMLAMRDKVAPAAARYVAGLCPTLTMADLLKPSDSTLAFLMLAAGEAGLYKSHAENPLPSVQECTAAQAAGRVASFLPLGDGTALAIGSDRYEFRAGGARGKGCQRLPVGRTAAEHGAVITKALRSALVQRLEAHAIATAPAIVTTVDAGTVQTTVEGAPETDKPVAKVPKVKRKAPTKGKGAAKPETKSE